MSGYDSRAVANAILIESRNQGMHLTIMQLLKLTFFAHGWSLALLDKPLCCDHVEAWQYGPVFPNVYKSLPGAGSRVIDSMIEVGGFPLLPTLNNKEKDILQSVVKNYGKMHAFELSDLTHQSGSPWDQTMTKSGTYSIIPNKLIQQYFTDMLHSNA